MRWGPNAEEAVYVHIFDHPVLFVATGEFDRFVEGDLGTYSSRSSQLKKTLTALP
jgi:hypothetical protein